jgi:hypothetical protein
LHFKYKMIFRLSLKITTMSRKVISTFHQILASIASIL